jgi:hypothetical protein
LEDEFPTTIRPEFPCALPRHSQMIQSSGMVYAGLCKSDDAS